MFKLFLFGDFILSLVFYCKQIFLVSILIDLMNYILLCPIQLMVVGHPGKPGGVAL